MKRVTIKDIAKLLNLNPSTVSRALKDHPDVSEKTRKSVKDLAMELGYRPNFQAIHFRNRSSGLIGIILPDISQFFYPYIIKAVEEEVRKRGFNLVVLQSGESFDIEMENIQLCRDFGVAGILASISKETTSLEHFLDLTEQGIPVVFFDKVIEGLDIPTVGIQDEKAAYLATQHLVERGYKSIAGIFDDSSFNTTNITQNRFSGFKKALSDHHLPVRKEHCLFVKNALDVRNGFLQLLENEIPIDAIFTMSDELLGTIMQVIYEKQIRIPQEMGVISISDGYFPYYLNPQITHIFHSGSEVGKVAAGLLFDLIQGNQNLQATKVDVKTELILLGST